MLWGRGGGTGRRTGAVEEEGEGLPEQGGAMGRPGSANAGQEWHRRGPGRVGFSMLLTIDAASGIPGLCGRISSVNLSETREVGGGRFVCYGSLSMCTDIDRKSKKALWLVFRFRYLMVTSCYCDPSSCRKIFGNMNEPCIKLHDG